MGVHDPCRRQQVGSPKTYREIFRAMPRVKFRKYKLSISLQVGRCVNVALISSSVIGFHVS